jgi:hypothetical protein
MTNDFAHQHACWILVGATEPGDISHLGDLELPNQINA